MARNQKLKVYRTPIGFHDAYVAAPSQKAALAAWGSDANLFARGIAEIVTDPDLTAEPLAHPGNIIRRSRGTLAEQIEALPPSLPDAPGKNDREASQALRRARPSKTRPKPRAPEPRPDRGALDEARRVLEDADRRYERVRGQLAERQAALDRDRRSSEKTHDEEMAKLNEAADRAQAAYERAMRKWRG